MNHRWFSSISGFPEKEFNENFKKYIKMLGGEIDPGSVRKKDANVSFSVFSKDRVVPLAVHSWLSS